MIVVILLKYPDGVFMKWYISLSESYFNSIFELNDVKCIYFIYDSFLLYTMILLLCHVHSDI